jgi:hypothetical protein
MELLTVNKDLEEGGSSPFKHRSRPYDLERLSKTMINLRIPGNSADIRTGYVPDTIPECYRYSNLLGDCDDKQRQIRHVKMFI